MVIYQGRYVDRERYRHGWRYGRTGGVGHQDAFTVAI